MFKLKFDFIKNKKNIFFYTSLILILIIFCIFSIYYYNTRPFGDTTFHLRFMLDFYNKGKFDGLSEHLWGTYGFPRFQQYTLNYPPLYHLIGTFFINIFKNKTVYIIDSFVLIILVIFTGQYIWNKTKSYFNVLLNTLILLLSSLLVSHGNNNLFYATFASISYLSLWLYFYNKKNFFLICYILSSVASFGSKQFFIFIFPFLICSFFIFCLKERKLFKTFFFSTFLILVLICPFFYFQIKTTGTISTQTIEGWPYIDKILPARHMIIEDWQKEIDTIVDIEKLRQLSERHYISINSGIAIFKENPIKTAFQWSDLNNYSVLPLSLKTNFFSGMFLFLFSISIFQYLFKKHRPIHIIKFLSILIPFLIIMTFTKRIEYVLFLPIMVVVFISSSIYINNKKIKALLLVTILIMLIINLNIYIKNLIPFSKNNYMRTKCSSIDIDSMYGWIIKNVEKNDLIMSANTQDDPYYTDKKYFYDYRLWFLNESDLSKYLPNYNMFKYIVIFKPSIKSDFDNWNVVPITSPLYEDLKNKNNFFKPVYENNSFQIYQKN